MYEGTTQIGRRNCPDDHATGPRSRQNPFFDADSADGAEMAWAVQWAPSNTPATGKDPRGDLGTRLVVRRASGLAQLKARWRRASAAASIGCRARLRGTSVLAYERLLLMPMRAGINEMILSPVSLLTGTAQAGALHEARCPAATLRQDNGTVPERQPVHAQRCAACEGALRFGSDQL